MTTKTTNTKKNFITITEIRLFTDENAIDLEKYFKVRYTIGCLEGEKVAQSTNTDMFAFMKEIIAAEFTEDWKEENQVKRMSYDEFAKSKYGVNFNADLQPLQTVAVKDLKRVVETLKKYEEQWQGIQNVTEAFQQMYATAEEDQEQNGITRLVERMFNTETKWDPDAQVGGSTGGIAWGAEFGIRTQHCIGNWFLQGHIEDTYIRVFKDHSNVGIYLSMDNKEWPDRYTQTFNVEDRAGFLKYLQEQCEWRVRMKGE